MRKSLDPRICNIALDANALDRNGSARDQLVDRFEKLVADGMLNVVLAGGVREEINNPGTPKGVKDAFLPRIFNFRPELIARQQEERCRVRAILQGNAKPGKHAADASHLSEAAETGCGYFVTHDARFLHKRSELEKELPPSLTIVTLEELLKSLDQHEHDEAARASKADMLPEPTSIEAARLDGVRAEKQLAVETVEDALDALDQDDREPDAWERDCLAMAINCIFRGLYGLAETEANLAMTPPNQRGRPSPLPDENLDFTKRLLRDALVQAKAEPVRLYPCFGPIVVSD